MQTQLQEQLSISDAEIILGRLPERIRNKIFLKTAQSLKLQGEPDWSEKIDQYLCGETLSDNG